MAKKDFTVYGIERSPEIHARSLAMTETKIISVHVRMDFSQGEIRGRSKD